MAAYKIVRKGIAIIPDTRRDHSEHDVVRDNLNSPRPRTGERTKGRRNPCWKWPMEIFPVCRDEAQQSGAGVERRRTADAGHRPGPRRETEVDAGRRADRGFDADPGSSDRRIGLIKLQQSGIDDVAGGDKSRCSPESGVGESMLWKKVRSNSTGSKEGTGKKY